MSKLIRFAVACAVATAGANAARADEKNELPAAVVAALEKADKVEVYSLTGDRAKEEPAWCGYASLGKTTVKGDDLKRVI